MHTLVARAGWWMNKHGAHSVKVRDFVFDFGGVVFVWNPAALVRSHFGDNWHGFDSPAALGRAIFSHSDWLDFDRGERTLQQVVEQTARRLAVAQATIHTLIAPIGEQLRPIETTVSLLQSLRERRDAGEAIRLLYLSNMPAPFARVLEQRHAFIDWFDGGIFSADVLLAKPQKPIYDLLGTRYSLQPGSTLFIDDNAPNLDEAAALGWQTLHLTDPSQLPGHLAQA